VADVEVDRKLERRPLVVDEMLRLVRAAASGTERSGVTGPDQSALYAFAFATGFRAGQIRSLTVGSFDLSADPPTVTAAASAAKRRVGHEQPLTPAVAADLRHRFATKLPAAPAFTMPPPHQLARVFRAELADARTACSA